MAKKIKKAKKIGLEKWELQERWTLPLDIKIKMTEQRIREWYKYWNGEVYVSFSGGKDSTVLLDIVRNIYPNVQAVFIDTGLEYGEIRSFVKTIDNVVWLKPKMNFKKVIEKYGYPVVSKKVARFVRDLKKPLEINAKTQNLRRTGYNQNGFFCPSQKLSKKWMYLIDAPFDISEQCCEIMKKEPFHRFVKETGKKPMNGVTAEESQMREKMYLRNGCNIFREKDSISMPIAFWANQDILLYLKEKKLPYCSVYGDIIKKENKLITTGELRTGCTFCCFGVHMEKGENRFQKMYKTHPKLWDYCMNKLGLQDVLDYIGVKTIPRKIKH